MNGLEQLQEESRKFGELRELKVGDIILVGGKEVEFTGLKRKNFDGIELTTGKPYRYPVSMFEKFLRKNENKPKEGAWKELKKDELFYIIYKGDAVLYRFDKIDKKRNKIVIVGINVATKVPTSIETTLYGGKVSDL